MVGLTECETVVENFFDFHFFSCFLLLATVMVGYMYDVELGREREKAREGERGTTLLLASAEWKKMI